MMKRLALLLALLALARPAIAQEPTVQLETKGVTGSITANGGAVQLAVGSMASLLIQTTGTFNLTWELECAADAAGTVYDTDDEIPVSLVSSSPTPADTVSTNVAGLYTANVAGCVSVQVVATAYTSGTMGVTLSAISAGGSSGGGGGAAGAITGTGTAGTPATGVVTVQGIASGTNVNVTCSNCSGTGVSANEDTAFAASAAVTPAGSQRQDTLSTDTDVTGDVQPIKGDAFGRLYTTGTGGTFPVSGVAAADAAVSGNPVYLAGRGSTATPTAMSTDGDVTPIWTDLNGRLRVDFSTIAGTAAVNGSGTATGALRVELPTNGTGVLATVGSLTQFNGVAIALNAGAVSTGTLRTVLASDQAGFGGAAAALADTTANPTLWKIAAFPHIWNGTTWDRAPGTAALGLTVNTEMPAAAALANATANPTVPGVASFLMGWNGTTWDRVTPSADSTHGSTILTTGPAIMGEATTGLTSDTAVTDGQATRFKLDPLGRQITVPGCGTADRVRGYLANTDGASTSVLAAQGAGVIAEIWTVILANSSATDVTVDLRDGTAGSVLTTLMAPATTDTGGGGVYNLNSPLLFTANTAVAADASAGVTTLYITVLGCKVK
jgi:hypothetical protein